MNALLTLPDATKWYEEALKINPNHVNASTDLGIAHYYMNQPDRALHAGDAQEQLGAQPHVGGQRTLRRARAHPQTRGQLPITTCLIEERTS